MCAGKVAATGDLPRDNARGLDTGSFLICARRLATARPESPACCRAGMRPRVPPLMARMMTQGMTAWMACGIRHERLFDHYADLRLFALSQPRGGIFGMIGDDGARTGALHAQQAFKHNALLVDPTVLRSRLDHGILT